MSTSPKVPKMLNDDDDVTGTDSCEQYHIYINHMHYAYFQDYAV